MIKKLFYSVVFGATLLFGMPVFAGCEISARVSIVGNEFPAIQTVGALSLIHI